MDSLKSPSPSSLAGVPEKRLYNGKKDKGKRGKPPKGKMKGQGHLFAPQTILDRMVELSPRRKTVPHTLVEWLDARKKKHEVVGDVVILQEILPPLPVVDGDERKEGSLVNRLPSITHQFTRLSEEHPALSCFDSGNNDARLVRHGKILFILAELGEEQASQGESEQGESESSEDLVYWWRMMGKAILSILKRARVVIVQRYGITGELRTPTQSVILYSSRPVANDERAQCASGNLSRGSECSSSSASNHTSSSRPPPSHFSADVIEALTLTTHKENGVLFTLNVTKIMFSSGNGTERMYMMDAGTQGETVVDMFAGIGYFSLPLCVGVRRRSIAIAKAADIVIEQERSQEGSLPSASQNVSPSSSFFSSTSSSFSSVSVKSHNSQGRFRLLAIELNPNSFKHLKRNLLLNKVEHLATAVQGDNRLVGNEFLGECDRVLMGYFPEQEKFLPRALSFLSPKRIGLIHYHHLVERSQFGTKALLDFIEFAIRPHAVGYSFRENQGETLGDVADADIIASRFIFDCAQEEKSCGASGRPRSFSLLRTKDSLYLSASTEIFQDFEKNVSEAGESEDEGGVVEENGQCKQVLLLRVDKFRIVKSYSPRIYHCVADMMVHPALHSILNCISPLLEK